MTTHQTTPAMMYMTAAAYHAAPALSAGGARVIINECPLLYWHGSPFNPDHASAHSAVFDIGSATHLLVLEQADFDERVSAIDADDYRTKAAQNARDIAHAQGRIPLTRPQFRQVSDMAAALRSHPVAAELLRQGLPERSLFWEEEGAPCKCRPDFIRETEGGRVIVDVKTVADPNPRALRRKAFTDGWGQRAQWYSRAMAALGSPIREYYFAAVGKTAPHPVVVASLSEAHYDWGRRHNDAAIALFRECLDANHWPAFEPVVHALDLPGYALFDLEERDADGAFAKRRPTQKQIRQGMAAQAPSGFDVDAWLEGGEV